MPRLILLVLLTLTSGCVKKAKEVIAGPEPEGGGTLTCRQIVEQCDAECSDPLCLHRCSPQGTPEARAQHDALLECGERASCTDEECIKASCPTEIDACMGPEPAPEPAPAQREPAPSGPPGETPPASRDE